MPDAPAVPAGQFIRLTTYTKAGEPKHVPVWFASLDGGRVGVSTQGASWKVKRIRNDPRVAIQPSNSRGVVTPGSEELTGTAEIVGGAEREVVVEALKAKYGRLWSTVRAVHWFTNTFKRGDPAAEVGIVITVSGDGGG
jgi:PPOX class probable F420-dependent enzyme